MIDMGNKYKAIKCNIPNSTALVEDFARSGYELISVVKESNVLYVYWFKRKTND